MNPVLVNVWRGNAIENHHSGAAAVVDVNGRVIWSIGDIQRPVFPRSTAKLMQALTLFDPKVRKKFDTPRTELAVACSSHIGETMHIEAVGRWLDRIGLSEDDLELGAAWPASEPERIERIRSGLSPEKVCHCCSGNHCVFLTSALAYGDPTHNYRLYAHPSQRRWFDLLSGLTGLKALQLPWGYDGCGIPTLALPLQRLAWAHARLADPSALEPWQAEGAQEIRRAILENPTMFAGSGELPTLAAQLAGEELIVKNGAEGVYTGILPRLGYGLALKIDSGDANAARVVLGAVLEKIAAVEVASWNALSDYFRPDVLNSRGEVVGRIEPSSAWDQGVLRF
ncbi:asparaginase [Granulosicoccaceae sp. 1_MG-2023]|nr:asparaginase [Granulosicoccaceae sp. 1_MG-2023]